MIFRLSRLICRSKFQSRLFHSGSNPGGEFSTDLTAFNRITHGVTPLNSYGIIELSGRDAEPFLQGMVSNDITTLGTNGSNGNSAIYSGILSPQGRFLYDCLVSKNNIDNNESYLLECDSNETQNIMKYLKKFKLRSKIKLNDRSDDLRVWGLLAAPKNIAPMFEKYSENNHSNVNRNLYIDPRCINLGIRLILDKNEIPSMIGDAFAPIGNDFYNVLRNLYGIPKFNQELFNDKSIILENNFQLINGVSFSKGCYVGQELIARTHHRGFLRKRLFPATIVPKNELNNGKNSLRLLDFDENESNRDLIFPQWFIDNVQQFSNVVGFESDLVKNKENISIINTKNSDASETKRRKNRSIGTILGHALNSCIVQLRNEAFELENKENKEYVTDLSLNYDSKEENAANSGIDWNEYKVLPHLPPYMHNLHQILTRNQE